MRTFANLLKQQKATPKVVNALSATDAQAEEAKLIAAAYASAPAFDDSEQAVADYTIALLHFVSNTNVSDAAKLAVLKQHDAQYGISQHGLVTRTDDVKQATADLAKAVKDTYAIDPDKIIAREEMDSEVPVGVTSIVAGIIGTLVVQLAERSGAVLSFVADSLSTEATAELASALEAASTDWETTSIKEVTSLSAEDFTSVGSSIEAIASVMKELEVAEVEALTQESFEGELGELVGLMDGLAAHGVSFTLERSEDFFNFKATVAANGDMVEASTNTVEGLGWTAEGLAGVTGRLNGYGASITEGSIVVDPELDLATAIENVYPEDDAMRQAHANLVVAKASCMLALQGRIELLGRSVVEAAQALV